MRGRRRRFLLLLPLLALSACAAGAPRASDVAEGLLPEPPSEAVRASLGRIAAICARHRTAETVEAAGWGEWAGAGAILGAARTVVGIARFFSAVNAEDEDFQLENLAFQAFIMVVSAPVGALIGALVGSVREGSIAEAQKTELRAAFRAARATMRIQESFRDRVAEASARAGVALVVVEGAGPVDPDAEADYRALEDRGIDTVLETDVVSVQLRVPHGRDTCIPVLGVLVRTRLISVADGSRLYEHFLAHLHRDRSGDGRLESWCEPDGGTWMREIQRAYGPLAERIADEIFLVRPEGPGEGPEGP